MEPGTVTFEISDLHKFVYCDYCGEECSTLDEDTLALMPSDLLVSLKKKMTSHSFLCADFKCAMQKEKRRVEKAERDEFKAQMQEAH